MTLISQLFVSTKSMSAKPADAANNLGQLSKRLSNYNAFKYILIT